MKKDSYGFKKYMENRTTPPKHKAFNKSKVNDVVSRLGDPDRKGAMPNTATLKTKEKKIELKEKGENVDEKSI